MVLDELLVMIDLDGRDVLQTCMRPPIAGGMASFATNEENFDICFSEVQSVHESHVYFLGVIQRSEGQLITPTYASLATFESTIFKEGMEVEGVFPIGGAKGKIRPR